METFLPNNASIANPYQAQLNMMLDWMRRNTIYPSSDILVSQTTHGTNLTVVDKIKRKDAFAGLIYEGLLNEQIAYNVNDVIFVDPNGTYTASFTSVGGNPALCAGCAVCITAVPSTASRASSGSYYPIYPTPTSQSYWQVIAPILPNTAGGYTGAWNATASFMGGQITQVQSTQVIGAVVAIPGTYALRPGMNISIVGSSSASGNQVPQFPLPSTGSIYWDLIAFAPTTFGVCSTTGTETYVNASAPS